MTRLVSVLVGAWLAVGATEAPSSDPHAYFDALVARSDHWKSYTLRDDAQLRLYRHSDSAEMFVTYDPGMDAAKILMPWFVDIGIAHHTTRNLLTADVDASTTTMPVSAINGVWNTGRSILIEREIMTIVARPDEIASTVTVTRGQFGTVATPHVAGTVVLRGSLGLQNQVRLPLGTQDGHTYVFTWDVYPTDSMVGTGLTNHKAFQFACGTMGSLFWSENNFRYSGSAMSPAGYDKTRDVATLEMRSYNGVPGVDVWEPTRPDGKTMAGPGVTQLQPVNPWTGGFIVKPNRWLRWWFRIEQRAQDFDYVDVWVADEETGPVQLYRRLPLSLPSDNGHTIGKFWIEFNTSQYAYTLGHPDPLSRPMVVYVRNFVALVDPPVDLMPLLVRPIGRVANGRPASPTGVRIH